MKRSIPKPDSVNWEEVVEDLHNRRALLKRQYEDRIADIDTAIESLEYLFVNPLRQENKKISSGKNSAAQRNDNALRTAQIRWGHTSVCWQPVPLTPPEAPRSGEASEPEQSQP